MRPTDRARRHFRAVKELLLPSEVRPPRPVPYRPSGREVLRARETLTRILTENVIPFWYPQVIDAVDGGYRLNHDERGRWKGPTNKRVLMQARVLWFFSRLANSEHGGDQHREAADHGYRFLRERMWDRRFGGFYWGVDAAGDRATQPCKHLCGQATALYALTEYAGASGEAGALALARDLVGLLEEHAYDPPYGGYWDFFARDWGPAPAGVRNYLDAPSDIKLHASHLHLMEAMTTYYRLTGDAVARDRLFELSLINSNAVIRKPIGVTAAAHERDWAPLRGRWHDRVNYGDDLKNLWLLMEACRAAGLPSGPLLGLHRTVFRYLLSYGFDWNKGGFYSGGRFNARADRRDKVWWVQAEGLLAALRLYHLTRERVHFACFARTLDWIANHQVDWQHGEWHARVPEKGRPFGDKADHWKASYHTGRAMLESLAWLPDPRHPDGDRPGVSVA
jgi:mannose/cellobiose epimerase-like protein (N-acyl-D-glucosamine 2-epimerase family)